MRYSALSPLECVWVGDDLIVDALSIPESVWEESWWDEEEVARWAAREVSAVIHGHEIIPANVYLIYPRFDVEETHDD